MSTEAELFTRKGSEETKQDLSLAEVLAGVISDKQAGGDLTLETMKGLANYPVAAISPTSGVMHFYVPGPKIPPLLQELARHLGEMAPNYALLRLVPDLEDILDAEGHLAIQRCEVAQFCRIVARWLQGHTDEAIDLLYVS